MSESFSVENIIPSEDCDDAWEQYINNQYNEDSISENEVDLDNSNIPKCSDIYISTKTKIAYLNKSIDLKECFWKIKVLQYYEPNNGVIKKQIKYNFKDKSEVEEVEKNLKNEPVVEQQIISKIDSFRNFQSKIGYTKDEYKNSLMMISSEWNYLIEQMNHTCQLLLKENNEKYEKLNKIILFYRNEFQYVNKQIDPIQIKA